jgi:hypothetical protein
MFATRPSAGKNRSGVHKIFAGTDTKDSAKIVKLSPCFVREQLKSDQDYEGIVFFPTCHLFHLGAEAVVWSLPAVPKLGA